LNHFQLPINTNKPTQNRAPPAKPPIMQGFNMGRYVPPDVEGTTTGNKLARKHALGARASKLASHGILTVRFEMPFPIWCGTCPKPTVIGQGVRFNAEKKRVGNYHTTPIWSFRFRHLACGGWIEIRTDPKNTAYVVAEGAKKQDTGEDKVREGDQVILTDRERDALRKNAFANLEKTIEDREQLKQATERIDDLMDASSRHWDDPYAQNQKLRKAFRVGRKEREREADATEGLKDRMSLGIDLVPATEEDARRAKLIDFRPADDDGKDRALSKPLFQNTKAKITSKSKLKGEKEMEKRKGDFVSEVIGNTRAAKDPFLLENRGAEAKPPSRLPGVKRKRVQEKPESPAKAVVLETSTLSTGLVNYDSD
jgi:coiled-coil domain-containing protein 130